MEEDSERIKKIIDEQQVLKTLLDEIPGGVGRYDYYHGSLELTYLNNAYFGMLGMERREREQYQGFDTLNAIHPDDVKNTLKVLDRLAAGEQHADIYQRVRNGKGEWVWMKFATSVTERVNGHLKLISAIMDCNELIRAQESLQLRYEDQVRYTRLAASGAAASSMVNLTTQTITLQNTDNDGIMDIITKQTPQQGFEAMYPCIPDEDIREEYMAIFDVDRITSDFERGLTHKSIRHPYMDYECWYESTYDAVRNPITNDLEVYCVAKDVSTEVLRNAINRRLMVHSYDEVVLINSKTGKPNVIVENYKSPVYEEQELAEDYSKGLENYFLKYSADENPVAVAESVGLAAVKKALESEDNYTVSYSIYTKDHRLMHKRAFYSYLNKYKTQILCAVQNITGAFEKEMQQREELRWALEQSKQASHAKADFYSRMSHDMRTPMNGILGMAALSEEETDITILKENIGKIQKSGEYLLNLINDTLDIQRIESGRMVLEPQIVSTAEITDSILDMVRVAARGKGVELRYNTGNADLNWFIRADALRLKQIFINLLSNAVKFTPEGGTVDFEFKLLKREGMISHDVIYVRDTGIGMSREFLENGIFKPFSQESNAVSTIYAGSGLGLSIAKSLVELMGGRIEVESELGAGTTFTVYLDFERVKEEEAREAFRHRERQNENLTLLLSGRKILLVEDHPLNAEIAQKILRRVGCEAVWVQNGQEAVTCFQNSSSHSFDAILMDIRMPVMDGLEAARQIRSLETEDAMSIPIIAMTANAYEEDIKKSIEAGMNAHLGKPIEPQKLYETLAEFM